MASGRLAALDITNSATDIQLYAVPSGKTTSCSISMVNRSGSVVLVRIALTGQMSINAGEYIAYDQTIYPNETYERAGLVLASGQYIYVRSSATSVNAVLYGYEE